MSNLDLDSLLTVVQSGPRPLFATVSGAHLYGFPSPDSDVDLRGAFVLPVAELLRLAEPQETITITRACAGVEVDWVAHDLRKFARMMTQRNGYVLEQLYSPLVVLGGPWLEELREIGRGCITRRLYHHYRGFAGNQRKLLAGPAPVYDPQTDAWTATGPMVKPHQFSDSVRLPDGRVLVAGGVLPHPSVPPPSARAEVYDQAANTWTAAANLSQARFLHGLVLLPDGQVLAVGGARDWDSKWNNSSFVREIERYDPIANAWRIVGELPLPRAAATVTLLPDGRVWVTGGRNDTTFLSDTWLIGAASESTIINIPKEGDTVAMTISVSGSSPKALPAGVNLYVLVKPEGLDYWLQPLPKMTSTGWQADGVGVGQPGDRGRAFRICAILTTQTLSSGWHASAPPAGSLTCINVTRD